MVLLTSLENFGAASGLFNTGQLEDVYHSFMDTAFVELARTITLHLEPIKEQDVTTQSQSQAQQINPYFGGRVPVPKSNTRGTGVKITHRDVNYSAQISVGPLIRQDDLTGMGNLKKNEAVITIAIEGLAHLKEAISISVEGRRYRLDRTKPIGFSVRRFVMAKLIEIQETETGLGENDG